jgi:hypothetical protein
MKNTNNNNMSIVPVVSYKNVDTLKLTISPPFSPPTYKGGGKEGGGKIIKINQEFIDLQIILQGKVISVIQKIYLQDLRIIILLHI